MSKEETSLASCIGYIFGKKLYETMTDKEREEFMEMLKNETSL